MHQNDNFKYLITLFKLMCLIAYFREKFKSLFDLFPKLIKISTLLFKRKIIMLEIS